MVGILISFWGLAYFQVRSVSFGVDYKLLSFPRHFFTDQLFPPKLLRRLWLNLAPFLLRIYPKFRHHTVTLSPIIMDSRKMAGYLRKVTIYYWRYTHFWTSMMGGSVNGTSTVFQHGNYVPSYFGSLFFPYSGAPQDANARSHESGLVSVRKGFPLHPSQVFRGCHPPEVGENPHSHPEKTQRHTQKMVSDSVKSNITRPRHRDTCRALITTGVGMVDPTVATGACRQLMMQINESYR